MTPVEIIALVLIIVVAVKLLVVLTKPAKWMKVVKKVWKNANLTMIICLVLAGVVLYYLLAELTIVQILAAMALLALLAGLSLAAYSKEMIEFAEKLLKKDKAVIKRAWLSILVWAVLILWGAGVLFGVI